uniref:Uncharacterized protein n=1 Tax=Monodelphis domestica TaxID=13616 RepID=A0A5F8GMG8_MONDO
MFKNLFNLGKQKTQPQACVPTTPRRDSGLNRASASGGYIIRKKDVGKLHLAASKGDVAKVQWLLLLKKQRVNETDKLNRTPLHLACASGYPDVVSVLVERNCNLNVFDSDNRTPLIKAVQCQREECVGILLSHGADPNVVDIAGDTALHYSALSHNTTIAAKLLEHKADIEAKNQDGYTPFLLAVRTENEKMVEFFLKNGANVNACDNSKRTALMIALTFGNKPTNIISLMIQHNVDLSCEDEFQWTAKNYANISIVDVNRELFLQHETRQFNQLPSARTSGPDGNSDIAFTLGGPSLDKEDIKNKKMPEGLGGPENKEAGLNVVEESAPEDSISRFSDKPGPDDSWLTSDEELDFNIQKFPRLNLKNLMITSKKMRNNNEKEDVRDSFPCHPVHLSPGTFSMPVQKMSTPLDIINKEELIDTEEEKEKDGALMVDNGTREQIRHEISDTPSELEAHNPSQKWAVGKDILSALRLEEEEDTDSPWDSECGSESLPKGSARQISAATNKSIIESISSGQFKDYPEKYPKLQPSQPTFEMKDSFTNKYIEKGLQEKQKSGEFHNFII